MIRSLVGSEMGIRASSDCAVATAVSVSARADRELLTRRGRAPTARARAFWSTQKPDSREVASAARTSSGVRLFAASATWSRRRR